MKKTLVFILSLILTSVIVGKSEAYIEFYGSTQCQTCSDNITALAESGARNYGFFPSYASGKDTLEDIRGGWGGCGCSGSTATGVTGCDSNPVNAAKGYCNCSEGYWTWYYPQDTNNWACTSAYDDDDDGICNDCDYAPENPNNPYYHEVAYQKDQYGNKTYVLIEIAGGQFVSYGTSILGETDYIIGNSSWKPISSLEIDGLCACASDPGLMNLNADNIDSEIVADQELIGNTPNDTILQGGDDDTGNTVDTEKLTDIVNNTARIANNQQGISDQLNDIENAIRIAGQQNVIAIGGISLDSMAGVTGQSTGENTNTDVVNKLQEIEDNNNTQGASELSQLQTDLDTFDTSGYNGNIPDGEVMPQEDSISDFFTNFVNNNPVSQYINNSSVTSTSPLCEYTYDWKGNTLSLGICQFAPELNNFGIIVNALSGLVAFMIVFRRGSS